MKNTTILIGLCLMMAGCSDNSTNETSREMTNEPLAPVAKKVPYEMEIHGHKRIDDYYWMRDDERKNPEILAHLEAENE